MTKRLICLALSLLMVLVVLTSCGDKGDAIDSTVDKASRFTSTMNFWLITESPEIAKVSELMYTTGFNAEIDYDHLKGEDLEKYAEQYLKVAIKALEKNAEYEVDNDEVKINGDKVNARVIEVTIDGDTLAAIVKAIGEELESDKKFRSFIINNMKEYEDILQENGIIEEDIDELYDEFVEELLDSVDDVEDIDTEIIITIATPKFTSKLMKLSLDVKEGKSKDNLFVLDLGKKGIKKTDHITLEIAEEVTFEYKIKNNFRGFGDRHAGAF